MGLNEIVYVAKLEFYGSSNTVVPYDFYEVVDDSLSPVQSTTVIVHQLKNKEIVKYISVDRHMCFKASLRLSD